MLLSEIKEYLQEFHLELNESVLNGLEKNKESAIHDKNENLANELWCLIETYKIQQKYICMFNELKKGNYENAWSLLEKIDITMGNLRENFGDGINHYHLPLVNTMIKYYEMLFPEYIFTSRESIIKSEKCSICGKVISLRSGCKHIPGKLYMGELCLREVTEFELLGLAIVKHPLDKYAIMKIDGMDYNYQVLEYLMSKLESPFRPWYVEKMTRKRPEYIKIGRNDRCPCDSGKKYKKCCMNTSNENGPHYKITLLGGEALKEEIIDYIGRWSDKSKKYSM
ncbi:MAG: SEC-C metal-binding domain-containing protein [Eubacteriales bacterium]